MAEPKLDTAPPKMELDLLTEDKESNIQLPELSPDDLKQINMVVDRW